MNYTIVYTSGPLDTLPAKVRTAIEKGLIPVGAPFRNHDNLTWCQAMIHRSLAIPETPRKAA